MTIKDQIYKMIKENSMTSFVDLETIQGFKGKHRLSSQNFIVFWNNISFEAMSAIQDLIFESKIEWKAVVPYFYKKEGKILNLPVLRSTKNIHRLKKNYWLPIIFKSLPIKGLKDEKEKKLLESTFKNRPSRMEPKQPRS
jgi:hypothetical protein